MSTLEPIDPQVALGVPREALPRHVAIIMDGNGRWARQRQLDRSEGHRAGVASVRSVITHCGRLAIPYLTLYSFSSENWKRPQEEVAALMTLYAYHLVEERSELMDNNVRLMQIGRRDNLPPDVLAKLDETVELSAGNSGLTLVLALNYGSRCEIVDGVRALARRVQAGELDPEQIDEATISGALYTRDIPDPDLLVRTAGQMRISNFLLWQISYTELHVSDVLWPDFRESNLDAALQAYAGRQRRFGAVEPSASSSNS